MKKTINLADAECPNGYKGENMKCCRCVRPIKPIQKPLTDKGGGWEEDALVRFSNYHIQTKIGRKLFYELVDELLASQKSQVVEVLEGMINEEWDEVANPLDSLDNARELGQMEGYNEALKDAIQKISGGDKK